MVIFALIFVFGISLLPSLVWLLFFLREDIHPEPKKLILYVFCLGGLISVPTLLIQIVFQHFALSLPLGGIILIVGLAFFEEIFKFLAAYLAIHKNPAFNEPIDAMIYMITAALGFATIENLFIIGNSFSFAAPLSISAALSVLSIRFVGATLLHALASGLIGYYWAKAIINKSFKQTLLTVIIFITFLHAIFNYLVLIFAKNNLIYPSIFLLFVAFFVFVDFDKLRSSRGKI